MLFKVLDYFIDGERHQSGEANAFSHRCTTKSDTILSMCRLILLNILRPLSLRLRTLSGKCPVSSSHPRVFVSLSANHRHTHLCILFWRISCCVHTWGSPRVRAPETAAFDPHQKTFAFMRTTPLERNTGIRHVSISF